MESFYRWLRYYLFFGDYYSTNKTNSSYRTNLSISIINKTFDPDFKGEWIGKPIYDHLYIQKVLSKKYKNFHYLPFVIVYLQHYNDNQNKECYSYISNIKSLKDSGFLKDLDVENFYINKYKNTKKRFTLYNCAIIKKTGRHSVYMLYDRKDNTIEIFDYILSNNYQNCYDLISFFNKIYPNVRILHQYKCLFLKNRNFWDWANIRKSMTSRGFNLTSDGFCVIWALWYLELRIKNAKFNREAVQKRVDHLLVKGEAYKSGQPMAKHIRGYAKNVMDNVGMYTAEWSNNKIKRIIKK